MSTSNLREALRKRYALPEWVLMEEVRDAAGHAANRSADGIAMSMWPSRGLEINGFELKASRSDWLRELKNPAKAEAIAAYCDRWWIVAMPGCVKLEEVPTGWGLLELDPKKGALKDVKKAPAREDVKPLTRTFVAAMMRRVGETDEWLLRTKVQQMLADGEKQRQEWAQRQINDRTRKYEEIRERLEQIKADTGIDLLTWAYDRQAIAGAMRFATEAAHTVESRYHGLLGLRRSMETLIRQIDELGPLVPVSEEHKEAA
jgi:hypothetical protein